MRERFFCMYVILFLAAGAWADGNDYDTVLLIHSDTTNGSMTFTDSSFGGDSGPHTISPYGDADSPRHKSDRKKFGATSMYFDGDEDYLNVPDSSDWDFGTDLFTIDFWINLKTDTATWTGIAHAWGATNGEGWVAGISDINTFSFHPGTGGGAAWERSSFNPVTNTWYHVAYVREGTGANQFKIYVDGSSYLTAQLSEPANATLDNTGLCIGRKWVSWNDLDGYIDELRVSKDVARWTNNFTPPAAQYSTPALAPTAWDVFISGMAAIGQTVTGNYTYYDPNSDPEGESTFRWFRSDTTDVNGSYSEIAGATNATRTVTGADNSKWLKFEVTPVAQNPPTTGAQVLGDPFGTADPKGGNDTNTVLLLHSDTTDGSTNFTDSSIGGEDSPHTTIPYGDADSPRHESDQKKFGATSMYFDGDGDYLSVPDSSDWDFGTDRFTIDFWINLKTDTATWTGIAHAWGATNGEGWVAGISDINTFSFHPGTGGGAAWEKSSFNPVTNTWYHVAYVREGTGANQFKIYVDGSSYLTAQLSEPANATLDNTGLCIGRKWVSWNDLDGYIDELRISKDVARWTDNFTPPTVPYSYAKPGTLIVLR